MSSRRPRYESSRESRIYVFLYSYLGRKGEKRFRLAAGTALVIIILLMLLNSDQLDYDPQRFLCLSGLFAALICLFYPSKADLYLFHPSKANSGKFVVVFIFSYALLVAEYPTRKRMTSERNTDWFFRTPESVLWTARSYRTYVEGENRRFDGDQDITLDFEKYLFEREPDMHFRNDRFHGILSRGGVSLIVKEGQLFLRVNIPVLLPHYTNINIPLQQREKLIAAIKKKVSELSQAENGSTRYFYDGNADTYDMPVVP
jgi:hypothetical protein